MLKSTETQYTNLSAHNILKQCQFPLHTYRCAEKEKAQLAIADNLEQSYSSADDCYFQNDDFILAARQLDWDTNHFGFGVGKVELVLSNKHEINKQLLRQAMDKCLDWARNLRLKSLSVQIDTGDRIGLWLAQESGFFLVDTILCYLANTTTHGPETLPKFIETANLSDQDELYELSSACFGSSNLNRFSADAIFAHKDIQAMYGLWAKKSVQGSLADQVLIYRPAKEIEGFITVGLPSKANKKNDINLGTLILSAVRANCQGKGIYTELVKAALFWLKQQGVTWAEGKTQVPNVAVHRAWQKLGTKMSFSHYTLHKTLY